ncbi:uncharacterized protein LOC133095096 isoform X2 [Eubalaena glacialis]|uniref:uncharacterized protein LOC133095096 isoform X2 n=1 Tax=Eubalaena glacialis TaxID=27606 RepID=UPI002A5A2737|nr:uncharacterized protein LOC133095096 isoform X2 [Eubalaena glacialis]
MALLLVLPFLAGAALSVLPATAAGSHSLHYNLTVLSRDGSVQSSFFAGGHLDGQAFLHYDRETGKVEPRGLWAEELGAETWDTESKDLTETWKDLRKLLAEILALQEEKGGFSTMMGSSSSPVTQRPTDVQCPSPWLGTGPWKWRSPGTQMAFKASITGPTCRESFVEDCGAIWNPGQASGREQERNSVSSTTWNTAGITVHTLCPLERPWCIRVSGGPSWVLLPLLLFLSSGFVSFAARRRRRRQHQLWGAQPLAYKTWINARWSQVTIMASHNRDFSPRCQTLRPSVPLGELRICCQRPEFSSLFWSY